MGGVDLKFLLLVIIMVLKYSTSKKVNFLDIDKLRVTVGWRVRGSKKWREIIKNLTFYLQFGMIRN